MARDFWFKPKEVGYGNVPTNAKGWVVTIAFGLLIVGFVVATHAGAVSKTATVIIVLIATTIYLPFIKAKTSGEWRWRSRTNGS